LTLRTSALVFAATHMANRSANKPEPGTYYHWLMSMPVRLLVFAALAATLLPVGLIMINRRTEAAEVSMLLNLLVLVFFFSRGQRSPSSLKDLHSAKLSPEEIIDLKTIVGRLQISKHQDPASKFLNSQLGEASREALANYAGGEDQKLRTALTDDLNRILKSTLLDQAPGFSQYASQPSEPLQHEGDKSALIAANRKALSRVYGRAICPYEDESWDRAEGVLHTFRNSWTFLCGVWALMYVAQSIGNIPRAWFRVNVAPGSPRTTLAANEAWWPLVIDLFSAVVNVLIVTAYGILLRPAEYHKASGSRAGGSSSQYTGAIEGGIFSWHVYAVVIGFVWVIDLLYFIGTLFQVMPGAPLVGLQLIFGLFNAVTFCALAGRLESRFIAPAPLALLGLYLYAATQVAACVLKAAYNYTSTHKDDVSGWIVVYAHLQVGMAWIYALIFLLKLLMLSFVYWLIRHGGLLFYFGKTLAPDLHGVESERRSFLKRFAVGADDASGPRGEPAGPASLPSLGVGAGSDEGGLESREKVLVVESGSSMVQDTMPPKLHGWLRVLAESAKGLPGGEIVLGPLVHIWDQQDEERKTRELEAKIDAAVAKSREVTREELGRLLGVAAGPNDRGVHAALDLGARVITSFNKVEDRKKAEPSISEVLREVSDLSISPHPIPIVAKDVLQDELVALFEPPAEFVAFQNCLERNSEYVFRGVDERNREGTLIRFVDGMRGQDTARLRAVMECFKNKKPGSKILDACVKFLQAQP
jgi:hypothetical protein